MILREVDKAMKEQKKLCPFRQFEPCIGDKCALYLKISSISIGDETFNIDPIDDFPSFPCALSMLGMKAFLDYFGFRPGAGGVKNPLGR